MRTIAEDNLQLEVRAKRKKFSPSVIVRDMMKEDPSRLRKALGTAITLVIKKEELKSCVASLHNLPRQGHMSWSFQPESAEIWTTALRQLPEQC